ncbi:ADP-ribosylglycohydrolase family protein [Haloechinothrix sp. YIM 98757]|uniref:ADP-ribosylglycohydrolase family protein n=1 Tax=Haloechinothrix aidingensis TaxID=2752311 RepID=A0A838AE22_9PSEU|nr:ADP-ribosylglycohydrolase family protein [Haloechinothrix aidingensis]MBA0127461.1 ADP-ribosylglycohydrolase family protein [Haloechinothrix aidingensis]
MAGVTREDKVLGLLLGTALGDALGASFEGRHAVTARTVDAVERADGTLVHTDDTALTMVLAEHLAARDHAGLDEDVLAGEFAAAWQKEPWRGYGPGAAQVFELIGRGMPWQRAAVSLFGGAGSYGNGGAMRVAPVAAVGTGPHHVAELGRRTASITHAHEDGQHGAEVQALAAYLALERESAPRVLDIDQFRHDLTRVVRCRAWHEKLDRVSELVRTGADPRHAAHSLGNDVTALGSVPMAVMSFVSNPDDPVAAIRYAIGGGGDTDTIGAMAGALAGARNGASTLPEHLVARLEVGDHAREVAGKLATAGHRGG